MPHPLETQYDPKNKGSWENIRDWFKGWWPGIESLGGEAYNPYDPNQLWKRIQTEWGMGQPSGYAEHPAAIYPEAYGPAEDTEETLKKATGMTIRSISGYDVVVQEYDDGTYDIIEVVGATGTTTPEQVMSAYQRAQIGIQQGQLGLQRDQLALQRQIELGKLQANPRDWIARWMAGQKPSSREGNLREDWTLSQLGPAYRSRQGSLQGLSSLEASQKAVAGIGAKEDVRGRMLDRTLTPEERLGVAKEWYLGQLPRLKEKKKDRPSAPPSPGWLPEFSPGQIAGKELQRLPVETPSGQQWSATPWSHQQGLAGYMDWQGGEAYGDMLSRMAMMTPQTPRKASWRPARQK